MYTDWYEVKGGMQDFNYDFSNAMEITIEVSCCKYPNRERILIEWENNIKSCINKTICTRLVLKFISFHTANLNLNMI